MHGVSHMRYHSYGKVLKSGAEREPVAKVGFVVQKPCLRDARMRKDYVDEICAVTPPAVQRSSLAAINPDLDVVQFEFGKQ